MKVGKNEPKRLRLATVREACAYGCFGVTKAYELLGEGKIAGYKMGARTLIDLDTIDRLHASLPRFQSHTTPTIRQELSVEEGPVAGERRRNGTKAPPSKKSGGKRWG